MLQMDYTGHPGGTETIVVSRRSTGCYEDATRRSDIDFVDADSWGVGLIFDGVHFSEAGHLAFAKGISQRLPALFST